MTQKIDQTQREAILINYISNLNEDGVRFALKQILLFPETRKYMIRQAMEFDRMYAQNETM
jgi:hypothetical protein